VPTTQPAPANTETDRQRQAEAAALALLLAGAKQRYSLPDLVKLNRIRPRRFGRIQPTNAMKADLAAPFFDIVRAFEGQVPSLMRVYAGGNGGADLIGRDLVYAEQSVAPVVANAAGRFPRVADTIERWHRTTWIQRVKAATGLDVSLFTAAQDVSAATDSTVAWTRQLATDVAQQMKHRAATDMIAGAATGSPPAEIEAKLAETVSKAKKRAAGIADDQVDKLSRAMDRQRREAAGVISFLWLHTPQKHPRDWHLARNGQVFTAADIPADDRAGVPPFCKCYELPLLQ
jgi:hypothetical protein